MANIDSEGDITLANPSLPESNRSLLDSDTNERTIWNLPEMKAGYFGAGFIDFSRVQDSQSSTWYSTNPVASFVVCQPTFEYVSAQVIVDASSGAVLEYVLQGDHMPIAGSQYLETWHEADGSTPARLGIGTAFLLASIFETGNTLSEIVSIHSRYPKYFPILSFRRTNSEGFIRR